MSFLSILLVASAFYFAHARSDTQPYPSYGIDQSDDSYPEAHHPQEVPDEFSGPMEDTAGYQHHLHAFMQDMSKTVDKYMTPLMSKLEKPKQEELKDMGLNGFASYLNYWLLLIEEIQTAKANCKYGQPHDYSEPRDKMILQYDSYHLMEPHMPYIAETQHDEDQDTAEK